MADHDRRGNVRNLLRLHVVAQSLCLAIVAARLAMWTAMVSLSGEQNLRAGETVSPEQRHHHQRRHERIAEGPHLSSMIHDFRTAVAYFLHTMLVFPAKPS